MADATTETPDKALPATALEVSEPSDFDLLLERDFKPTTTDAHNDIKNAVVGLAGLIREQSGEFTVSEETVKQLEELCAGIDKVLTDQVNEILHDEKLQELEGTWRGLNYLVSNTLTDEMLKIKCFDISKEVLHKTLDACASEALRDQSPLFKQIYEEEFGMLGGEPFACLVGDYYFSHKPMDVTILDEMAQIGAAAHCPFIAGADPAVMQMSSWQELKNPRDLTKIFQNAEYAPWRSLRESEDSRYVGLALPRFLSRLPYGPDKPVEGFDFVEDVEGRDPSGFAWSNSAYAMARNITSAFSDYGWCTRIRGIESGGAVEGLPVFTFPTDDGGVDMTCPTEIAIGDRREAELAKNGFMPVLHRKNSDFAAFIGAQSLQQPAIYDSDADAQANANLSARLPYLFASSRFAHYLKAIVRDKVGSFTSRDAMEKWLSQWILKYVDGDPANSSQEVKARKPLAAAEVVVEDVEGNPGYYTAKFSLRPHYQLEGVTVSMSLVSKLPSEKQ